MMRALRFALPAYLLLEISVTLEVAAWLGAGRALLLLLLGMAGGIVVLRRQQLAILTRLCLAASSGEPPLPGLLDGAMRAIAGILLMIPGYVSDAAALALLIPKSRRWLTHHLSGGLVDRPGAPIIIEGDFRRVEDPALPGAKRGP
jgi:UPF0716 protein FxsA